MRIRSSRTAGIAFALGALVLVIYAQAGSHSFVDFDDDDYVYENAEVRRGLTLRGLRWAFTTTHAANWHPLTWLSHMLDVQLFGLEPGWHHGMSVFIHAVNAVLLFLVLKRMTGAVWRSALVAALFAAHPLHVESVAWVAERKDVLSTLFLLLTIAAYLEYVRRPSRPRYALVAFTYALGLLAKPMLVTLPFVLLLLDAWPLGRMPKSAPGRNAVDWHAARRLLLEKIPLLALAALSSVTTVFAQQSGDATVTLDECPATARVANALVSYVAYLVKSVWPASLAVFYPHPATLGETIPIWQVIGAASLLAGISVAALGLRKTRPSVATGWFWYLGTLVPVIGVVTVGGHALADRYTYVPLIGIFLAVAWALPDLSGALRLRAALVAAAVLAIGALSFVAHAQVGTWRNSRALFTRAVLVTRDNWLAWNKLGIDSLERGEPSEALAEFQNSLRILRGNDQAWYNAGVAFSRLDDVPHAIDAFREAVRLRPDHAFAWVNLGASYLSQGRLDDAAECLRTGLRFRPDDGLALYKLGLVEAFRGNRVEALDAYRRLAEIDAARADDLGRIVMPP